MKNFIALLRLSIVCRQMKVHRNQIYASEVFIWRRNTKTKVHRIKTRRITAIGIISDFRFLDRLTQHQNLGTVMSLTLNSWRKLRIGAKNGNDASTNNTMTTGSFASLLIKEQAQIETLVAPKGYRFY